MSIKYKFGLIKDDGVWNNPSTHIYYNTTFNGYKPIQSSEIFGLINSTDGNFWLLSEDDDYYSTTVKISEETIRELFDKLKNNDLSDSNIFGFKNDNLIELTLTNLQNDKKITRTFHKDWIPVLIKTLDIDNPIKSDKEILPIWEKLLVPDKIKYPIMTPEEYIYASIENWPSLYVKNDFELIKFKIYDDLINKLSSYETTEEFIDGISKNKEIDFDRVKRYLNEKSFNGYSDAEKINIGTKEIVLPKSNTCIVNNIFEDEKEKYPNVIYWQINNNNDNVEKNILEKKGLIIDTKFSPYPNFQKKYSTLWNNKDDLLNKLPIEWIEEFIWFYQTSLQAINDGCYKNYSQFPTGSEKEDKSRMIEMQKFINNKSNEQISKDYDCEYNGDLFDFMSRRWEKQKIEYELFINEIIEVLADSLSKKNEINFDM